MQREPFDASEIRSAGYDPAAHIRADEFCNHRSYRYLEVPPADWVAQEDAEAAAAHFTAHRRNAYQCWRLINLARARHPQAAPL
jgi:hypothetical protein